MKVFGIDIIKGSVRSRTRRPVYALCRIEDGEILGVEEVTWFRLQRILATEQPEILAVDSLQEIAADRRELYAFLQALPPSTKLVQVTGGERKETLGKVAARYNISFNKFDPYAEARTTAQVASLGAGVEVIAFENTTDIVVSRRRSPGRGGWSQNRYTRKIHGAVMQKSREIEARLRGAGLDYEKKETKAFGGYSRVAFQVIAPRDMVPVHSSRGADVQVRVAGRELDRIRFKPLSSRPRYLIVGLDPGTTTGIAALDLDGNLVLLSSSRQMTMSDIVEELYRAGKPLIIASDVQQMPYSVEKIRRAFNAIPYTPKQSLSVEAKYDLTAQFSYTNDHERDALSAALDAHRSLQNKFRNIAKRVQPGFDLDEVRARVLRGQSLDAVLADMQGAPAAAPPAAPPEAAPERQVEDERVMALDAMVKRLRSYVQELQDDLRERDREVERLQQALRRERSATGRKLRRDAELATKDAMIENLRRQLPERAAAVPAAEETPGTTADRREDRGLRGLHPAQGARLPHPGGGSEPPGGDRDRQRRYPLRPPDPWLGAGRGEGPRGDGRAGAGRRRGASRPAPCQGRPGCRSPPPPRRWGQAGDQGQDRGGED